MRKGGGGKIHGKNEGKRGKSTNKEKVEENVWGKRGKREEVHANKREKVKREREKKQVWNPAFTSIEEFSKAR